MTIAQLKSLLYLPANRASAVAKARTLACDAVILDLEDAVQPDAKDEARTAAVAAAHDGGWEPRALFLRINAADTAWHEDDLAAARTGSFAGVVAPKIDTAAQAQAIVAQIGGRPLLAMIETPRGVLNAAAIAAVPGVAGLVAGLADLAKALNTRPDPQRRPLIYAMSAIVLAARAADVACFDGVCTDVRNIASLRAEAAQARMLGFDGKTLIHPGQVDPCNEIFAPSAEERADAQALIAAYEAALAQGRGVATWNGQLVEVLHVAQARAMLARA
ncbi:CoA ester lyase [Sandarakinorhabdus sp.]|uniref:HpcH/HpaI aldolase/citrate lyase family protein n=1 Tax=Sandarakinorhabdus sp. TaxID=1916663 RepID=UPI00333E2835